MAANISKLIIFSKILQKKIFFTKLLPSYIKWQGSSIVSDRSRQVYTILIYIFLQCNIMTMLTKQIALKCKYMTLKCYKYVQSIL